MKGSSVHHDGILYTLEDPATMVLKIFRNTPVFVELVVLCYWLEEEGLVVFKHDEGVAPQVQESWAHGSKVIRFGHEYQLPTEQTCEKIIELLRLLEGVEY